MKISNHHLLFSRASALALLLASLSFATTPARAANGTWAGNVSGNWSDTANWTPVAVPGGANSTVSLTYNLSLSDKTVTIDTTSRTVGILNIGDEATAYRSYTLAASGGASLILDNGLNNAQINKIYGTGTGATAADTISAPLLLNSSLVISDNALARLIVNGGVTANSAGIKTITNQGTEAYPVQMNGVIGDGSGQIAVTQNSTTSSLTLNGTNTYSGNTLIRAGTLTLGNNLALQNSVLDTSGAGTLAFSSGINTPTFGGLTGAANLTLASNVTGLTLNPGTGVTATYSGVLGSTTAGMTLTKTGLGTQVLSGNNTYTGGTTVSAGTFFVDGNQTAATGAVNILAAATLGGDNGIIGGNTTIADNATLSPGKTGESLLTFSNNLTFAGTNSKVIIGIAGAGRGSAGGYDAVDVGGVLGYNGNMTFAMNAAIADGTYDIYSSGSGTALNFIGSFASLAFSGGHYTGAWSSGSGIWTANSKGQDFTFTEATGDLVVAVPEPASISLLVLGAAALFWRRRKCPA